MATKRTIWAPHLRCYNRGYAAFTTGIRLNVDPYNPRSRKRDVKTDMQRMFSAYWRMGWRDARAGRLRGAALEAMRDSS